MASRRILVVACLNFITIGILSAVIGPVLPTLAHQTGSALSELGALISALFVGALIAQITGGPLNDHLGSRPLLLVGLGLTSVGVAGIALSPALPLTLACGVLAGIGHGSIDLGTGVLVAVIHAEKSVFALNLINVFFGIGAALGPAAVSLALLWWHNPLLALWLSGALAALLIPAVAALALPPPIARAHSASTPRARLYRAPVLWMLAGVVLLYVGLENGIGGWIAVYVQRTTTLSLAQGALIASMFWLALTVGRLLATAFGTRVTPRALLLYSLAAALAGTLALATSAGQAAFTVAAVALIGLGFGPVFPTTLAITTATFSANPGRAAGVTQTAGSAGGILIPWLQGIVLFRIGAQTSTLFVAALAAALLTLGWLPTVRRRVRTWADRSDSPLP